MTMMNGTISSLRVAWLLVLFLAVAGANADRRANAAGIQSHVPTRPLPVATQGALTEGAKRFVDANRGNDKHDGTQAAPWKSLVHAQRQLRPGDTLYLR